MVETDALWGGTLVSVPFDPVTWTLRFSVEINANREHHRYELMLDGVSEWISSRGIPLPWNYAEQTEVHVSDALHRVHVQIVLWDDHTSLSARCASVRMERKQQQDVRRDRIAAMSGRIVNAEMMEA